ncbi:hypothetical protein PNA2_1076 [Pyrococcus sp. NA2]|uniref:hypothetical protein n=1 Tax=Pyrococcus sp. (strain NA2) TaxID=342949 RepID=UPI000209AA85|nr:hypothetical protein [Pyrococcus sp. NA2]AEC51991.1 hypothetical protein PNA2_1076 [Pyrococcus sp. NA2]
MKKTFLISGILLLIFLIIIMFYVKPTTTSQPIIENNQTSPVKDNSTNVYRLLPSYVGYAYVYPNEPIQLTFYWCYPGNFNSSTNVVLSLARFHQIYNYEKLKNINRTFLGYIPLTITMNFSKPNYQYSYGVYAKAILWVGENIANESSVFVDISIQVANITPEDVPLEFGHYSSSYVSFTKENEIIAYAVEIRNPTGHRVEILNVSYPRLVVVPSYNISILKFGILNASDVSRVPLTPPKNLSVVLPPHGTGVLVTYIQVGKDVQGLYFKPRITLRIENKEIMIPGPPFSYVRITEPCPGAN